MHRTLRIFALLLLAAAVPAQAQQRMAVEDTLNVARILNPATIETGALEASDQQSGGVYFDQWIYRGSADERLAILMRSDAFDAFLRIGRQVDGEWRELASDDDGGGNRDSRIDLTLPEDGDYEIHATAYQEGETGAYTLAAVSTFTEDTVDTTTTMDPDGDGTGDTALDRDDDEGPRTILPGEPKTGRLEPRDAEEERGAFVDMWWLPYNEEGTLTIHVHSEDFDPVVRVFSATSGGYRPVGENDNADEGTDSRLTITVSADNAYRIHVTTYRAGEGGAYTLRVERH